MQDRRCKNGSGYREPSPSLGGLVVIQPLIRFCSSCSTCSRRGAWRRYWTPAHGHKCPSLWVK
nr:MAG TPA: hypothetical protein [Caudoviricetes sp.]